MGGRGTNSPASEANGKSGSGVNAATGGGNASAGGGGGGDIFEQFVKEAKENGFELTPEEMAYAKKMFEDAKDEAKKAVLEQWKSQFGELDFNSAAQWRNIMGQTGNEAGMTKSQLWEMGKDPHTSKAQKYVGCWKSANINIWLQTKGKELLSKISPWGKPGYPFTSKDAKKIVQEIDEGMKPLPGNVKLSRFETGTQFLKEFGLNPSDIAAITGNSSHETSPGKFVYNENKKPMSNALVNETLSGLTRNQAAYASASYDNSHNAFTGRDVKINMYTQKGVDAIITKNHKESEVLLGRGYTQEIVAARVVHVPAHWDSTTSKHVAAYNMLEVDVKIVKDKRPEYYDV